MVTGQTFADDFTCHFRGEIMPSSCRILLHKLPKVERVLWRLRAEGKNPGPTSLPLALGTFATETARSYLNHVEEGHKVDQVFCDLVDQYSERNCRHMCVS